MQHCAIVHSATLGLLVWQCFNAILRCCVCKRCFDNAIDVCAFVNLCVCLSVGSPLSACEQPQAAKMRSTG